MKAVITLHKTSAPERLFRKGAFIVVLSAYLSAVYLKNDLYFEGRPSAVKLFTIYLFTGLSLLWIHLKHWNTDTTLHQKPKLSN